MVTAADPERDSAWQRWSAPGMPAIAHAAFIDAWRLGREALDREREASELLRWESDQRAIKRWQEATGRIEVWPDHTDLSVFLLGELERAKAAWAVFGQRHNEARGHTYGCPLAHVERGAPVPSEKTCGCGLEAMQAALGKIEKEGREA